MATTLLTTALARAEHPAQRASQQHDTTHSVAGAQQRPALRWYGWQTVLADGASLSLFIAARSSTLRWTSVATYATAGPLIHAAHGHGWRALGSLGLHVGGTAAAVGMFGLIGCHDYTAADYSEQVTCANALAAAFTVLISVSLVDAIALGFDRPRPPARRPAQPTASVGIGVSPTRRFHGISLHLRGTFEP